MPWTAADIPSQAGRVAVVTGATSGLGYHTAAGLARAGAEVVLAVRDTRRGEEVREQTGAHAVVRLDLAELASVRAAAQELTSRWPRIDVLVNNTASARMERNRLKERVSLLYSRGLGQSDEMGALPQLYAATMPDLPGGAFVGPDGLLEQRGHPKLVSARRAARDEAVAGRLWEVSEQLTGVRYLS